MAKIETVRSATQAEADLADESINPDMSENYGQIQVTLVFTDASTPIDMDGAIYDMVNDKFGTIRANKMNARGTYEFIVT